MIMTKKTDYVTVYRKILSNKVNKKTKISEVICKVNVYVWVARVSRNRWGCMLHGFKRKIKTTQMHMRVLF